VIILDTHIGVWWSDEISRLTAAQLDAITDERFIQGSIGISAITCWEIAMLVERQRITLQLDALSWLRRLLSYPGVELLPVTPEIAVRAYSLPEPFHRDPADRILVATAIELACPLLTDDGRILAYPHVNTIG
jgi:PIN domain nuclease of toxin-antitoxin system